MQYQDYYNLIQPTSMYDTVKAAQQDRLVNQENQLIMQQKQFSFNKQKATSAYKTLSAFKRLTPEQQAAQWTQTRQTLESIYPEKRGAFPSSWDLDPQGNARELDTFLSGISQLVEPERVTVKEGEVIQERMPGEEFKPILTGPKKPQEPKSELRLVDTVDLATGQPIQQWMRVFRNEYDDEQVGNKIFPVEFPNGVDRDWYYSQPEYKKQVLYPERAPRGYNAEPTTNSEPPINALKGKTTLEPMPYKAPAPVAVPGQIELPPRQFNVPSPTNQTGETNQGYGIDENAMLQQPQIMPSMGNMMLKGAGAVMADEYAPQPRNALVGGMMQPPSLDGTMPPPSQFAELMPAGSAPNRFGSPGVEGMEFAATGGQGTKPVRPMPPPEKEGFSLPRFVATDKGQVKEVFRPMTPEEIKKEGQDPTRITGRVSQFGVIQWQPKTTPAQLQKEGAEAKAAEATAAQNQAAVRRARTDIVSFLRGVRRYRSVLNKIGQQSFFDTGPIDTFITENTELGSELNGLGETVGEELKSAMKVTGDPKTADELKEMVNQLPNTRRRFTQNIKNLNFREEYFLDRLGVQTSVANDAEFDALTPGTVFVDLSDGGIYRKMKAK